MAEVSLALSYPEPLSSELRGLCRRSYFFTVECLIGKHKKPILFKHKHKVTEPSSVPYRAPPACAKMAAYPDPPPVIPVPDTGAGLGEPLEHMLQSTPSRA